MASYTALILCALLAFCLVVCGISPALGYDGPIACPATGMPSGGNSVPITTGRNECANYLDTGNIIVREPSPCAGGMVRLPDVRSAPVAAPNGTGNILPCAMPAGNDAAPLVLPPPAFVPSEVIRQENLADENHLGSSEPVSVLPQMLRWPTEEAMTETPTILYPGYQYIDRSMDRWFTNQYMLGCGKLAIDGLVRSYYVNDQRLEASGMEATFAAEAAVTARYERKCGDIGMAVGADFFITQPYDRNMYDTPVERSYFANYDYQPFDISQLYVEMQKNQFACRVGKMITPFGRYYYPVDTNQQFDAPFIRTECIRKRETGVLLSYLGDNVTVDVGGINGCDDRDTNSSKGVVGRFGYEIGPFTAGVSGKYQDGIGSEDQKEFNNNFGADFACRAGKWTVSSEVIYDEYGLYHQYNPNEIFWEHSIYGRQVNLGTHRKITGVGWYIDTIYRGEKWLFEFNYGQYHPQQIGIPQNDAVNNRGIFRVGYDIFKRLEVYNLILIERGMLDPDSGEELKPWVEMVGLRYLF
jgi:hypothetical protein